jgi:hypothetical protein
MELLGCVLVVSQELNVVGDDLVLDVLEGVGKASGKALYSGQRFQVQACHFLNDAGTKKRSVGDFDVGWSVDRCVGLVFGGWVMPDVDDVD